MGIIIDIKKKYKYDESIFEYLDNIYNLVMINFKENENTSIEELILKKNFLKTFDLIYQEDYFNNEDIEYIISFLKDIIKVNNKISDQQLKYILVYFSMILREEYQITNYRYDFSILNKFIQNRISCAQYNKYMETLYNDKVYYLISSISVNKINISYLIDILFAKINYLKSNERKILESVSIINFYKYYFESTEKLFENSINLKEILNILLKEMNEYEILMNNKVFDLEYEIVYLLRTISYMNKEDNENLYKEILKVDEKRIPIIDKIMEIIYIIYEFYDKYKNQGIIILDFNKKK